MNQLPRQNRELVSLSTISPKDKPWDKHRLEASELAALYEFSEFPQYGKRINQCANILGFGLLPDSNGTISLKLREARFCRVRHCPVCQWRRSLMWRARFFEALPKIRADYPKARFIFLTLTVKNCVLSDLRETLDNMNKGFKRLTKLSVWPGLGWVKTVEVTRGVDGTAHPHFHCLIMVSTTYFSGAGYLKQQTWRELWKQSLRIDYDPMVNIQAVKFSRGSDPLRPSTPLEDLMKAVTETIKYSVKPSDVNSLGEIEWLNGLTEQLMNTRAIAIGGCFRQYLSEKEPENLIKSEAENEEEQSTEVDPKLFFNWRERYSKYLQKV